MLYLTLFAATVLGVSAKAAQQLNVQHHRLSWVPPVSYAMAFTEIVIISQVATAGGSIPLLVAAMGTGGWVGCIIAMELHRRFRGVRKLTGVVGE